MKSFGVVLKEYLQTRLTKHVEQEKTENFVALFVP